MNGHQLDSNVAFQLPDNRQGRLQRIFKQSFLPQRGNDGIVDLDGMFPESRLDYLFFKRLDAPIKQRRSGYPVFREPVPGNITSKRPVNQVNLVDHDDRGLVPDVLEYGNVIAVQWPLGLHHKKHQVRVGDGFGGLAGTDAFDGILGFMKPGAINQNNGKSAQVDGLLDGISGGSGHGGHNGPFFLHQAIEQTRFSHIGTTDNCDFKAVADETALIMLPNECLQWLDHPGVHPGDSDRGLNGFRHIVGKVYSGFGARELVDQMFPHTLHGLFHFAVHLGGGHVQKGVRAGADNVHHRLGLGKINAPV